MFNLKNIFIGCFALLGIYHLFVFVGRKKDFLNLIYALYCFSLANIVVGDLFYHSFNKNYFSHVYFITASHLFVGLIIIFSYLFFKLKKSKFLYVFVIYYIFLSLFLVVIFIISYKLKNYFFILLYCPVCSLLAIYFIFIAFYNFITKKNELQRNSIFVIIGFSLIMVYLVIFSILIIYNIMIHSYISYSVYLINALFFAYALTDNFNKEHRDLIDLKNNLKQKVEERTKELVNAKEEIEKKEQQKTNFFINLAHETKTPLTLITNYLDKDIEERGSSNEINIVKQNFNKLKNDMINFLDIVKLERGQIFYNHEKIINLSKTLENIIILFKEYALKKDIKIINDIKKNIYIKIDPYAADRIINNLIDNAIKYSKNKGKINITLKSNIKKNNNVELKITDQGIGISIEQQEHIFEPYHQISHKKRNVQGIGMGLNIVKKIMDEIGGKIEVKSKLNEGTTFTLNFEKYHKTKNDEVYSNIINLNYNKNTDKNEIKKTNYIKERKNILIIEDNIQMLNYLDDTLSEYHNIFTAKNGKAALEIVFKIPKPNLIISDIMMDEMDGYEFYDELIKNEKYASIPFIFLTAKTTQDEKITGLGKGAIDYIFKPFSIDEIKNKINSILKLQKNQRKNNIKEIGIKFSNLLNKNYTIDKSNEIKFNILCNDYKITSDEKNIIKLLLTGAEYKEISLKMNISVNIINKRIQSIYKKLGIHKKIELVNIFS